MESTFTVSMVGDLEFDNFVAHIGYCGNGFARISQERAEGDYDIEIFPCSPNEPWIFQLKSFEEVMQDAKQGLWEMREQID